MERDAALNPLDQLTREIRKVIDDNSSFLARITDDAYEPEVEPDDEVTGVEL